MRTTVLCLVSIQILTLDTIGNPILLNTEGGGSSSPYNFSSTGIAWPGEAKKYVSAPGYNLSAIVPPPNWAKRFPNNYTTDNPPPDLRSDEHFQNWMRTAGLPTFSKLWGRNDTDDMKKGTYNISVELSAYLEFIRGRANPHVLGKWQTSPSSSLEARSR